MIRDRNLSLGWTDGARLARLLLFLDGGDRLLGGVVQVFRRCDGQAALRQNPLGLLDVGPWRT